MSTDSHILCYGNDDRLIETRGWVLESAGFLVKTTTEIADFERLLSSAEFDVIVLCHSLKPAECDTAIELLHKLQPQARTLILKAVQAGCNNSADSAVNALDGPDTLVRATRTLLRSQRAVPANQESNLMNDPASLSGHDAGSGQAER